MWAHIYENEIISRIQDQSWKKEVKLNKKKTCCILEEEEHHKAL